MKGNCYNPYAARGIAVSCFFNCQRRDYNRKQEKEQKRYGFLITKREIHLREFDSLIIKKSIAGLVIPAFFMSTFLF